MKKIAAYENEANPANRRFWQQIPQNHPFAKHPILSQHGKDLSRAAFDFTKEKMGQEKYNPIAVYQTFQRIMQLEQEHAAELTELAKDVTVQIWGINKNMLEGRLTTETAEEFTDEEDDQQEDDQENEVELKEEVAPEVLEQEIHKRMSMNAMTHGSAVHAMFSMHHIVNEALNKISPELVKLYNKFSAGTTLDYWMHDISQMANQMGNAMGQAAIGSVKIVKDEQAEKQNPNQPQGAPLKIDAKAWCFPVLCQEMSKGVMELITLDSLAELEERMPRKQVKQVHEQADRLVDEPWLIQVGPELWRKFIKVLPQGANLAEVVATLTALPPAKVHEILDYTVRNPQKASETLQNLLKTDEPEENQAVEFEAPQPLNLNEDKHDKETDEEPDWKF